MKRKNKKMKMQYIKRNKWKIEIYCMLIGSSQSPPHIRSFAKSQTNPSPKNWQTTLGMWALRAVSMGLIKKEDVRRSTHKIRGMTQNSFY